MPLINSNVNTVPAFKKRGGSAPPVVEIFIEQEAKSELVLIEVGVDLVKIETSP